jgi:thymidylate synthase
MVDTASDFAKEYEEGIAGRASVKELETLKNNGWRKWKAVLNTKKNSSGSTRGAWNKLWSKRRLFYDALDAGGDVRDRAIASLNDIIEKRRAPAISRRVPLSGRNVLLAAISEWNEMQDKKKRRAASAAAPVAGASADNA